MDNRTIKHIMRNPHAYAEYCATGRVPERKKPTSPLITLLDSIYPRERAQITAVTVNQALGYQGSRSFHNAAQALNWLSPHNPGVHIPSESWIIRTFHKQLTIDDLAQHARVPDRVVEEWWGRNRRLAHLRKAPAGDSATPGTEGSQ